MGHIPPRRLSCRRRPLDQRKHGPLKLRQRQRMRDHSIRGFRTGFTDERHARPTLCINDCAETACRVVRGASQLGHDGFRARIVRRPKQALINRSRRRVTLAE
jgi:hypothetical protein